MKAYPNLQIVVSDMGNVRAVTQSDSGMDLRDYFAAQVLPKVIEHWPSASFLGASEIAYDYADAMMKARSE